MSAIFEIIAEVLTDVFSVTNPDSFISRRRRQYKLRRTIGKLSRNQQWFEELLANPTFKRTILQSERLSSKLLDSEYTRIIELSEFERSQFITLVIEESKIYLQE